MLKSRFLLYIYSISMKKTSATQIHIKFCFIIFRRINFRRRGSNFISCCLNFGRTINCKFIPSNRFFRDRNLPYFSYWSSSFSWFWIKTHIISFIDTGIDIFIWWHKLLRSYCLLLELIEVMLAHIKLLFLNRMAFFPNYRGSLVDKFDFLQWFLSFWYNRHRT